MSLADMVFPAWDRTWDTAVRHGEWEETLREAALDRCAGRRHFVDAGAHAGVWSRAVAPLFAAVTAFEPNAEAFTCLERNTGHLPNVHRLPAALSDARGELRFALPHDRANSGQMMVTQEVGQPAEAITLDSLGIHDLDLLKLDVEGWELPALVGARETIRRCRPVVVMEENRTELLHGLPERGARGFLLGLGYRVADAFPDNIILTPEHR